MSLGLGVVFATLVSCRPPETPRSPDPVPVVAEAPNPATPDPHRAEVLGRLEEIGVIGASVAAGFGTGVTFADTLDAALRVPHQTHDSSVALMHLRTAEVGSLQIAAMKLRGVDTVFAVDFLFWFAHGDKDPQQRRSDLHDGMAMLESLQVPVFVGDLPDVHGASRRMIAASMIPSPQQLSELNAEIHAWAEEHPQIHVLPLAAWMAAIVFERPLRVDGRPVQLSTGQALQWDRLHPTPRGQALLTLLTLEQLRTAWGGGLAPDDVVHSVAAVAELAEPSRAPAPPGSLPGPPP